MTPSTTLEDLGYCTPLVAGLREANLLKHPHLDTVKKFLQGQTKASPEALAAHLVSLGILTRYQADQALVGNAAKLALWTYTLLDPVGTKTRPTLFKARNKADNKLYCVKILPRRNALNLPKMARQLKPFQEFKHDSVIPIVHIGASGDRQYLVWPFISEGETLRARVEREGRLSVEDTLRFAIPAAEGLAICHQHGMIHGALKPSNFLLAPDGKVRMLSFGIGFMLTMSKDESLIDTMNTQEQLSSCIDCGAPESLLDPTNRQPQGDQYSLGCVLYYCLSGQFPFPEGSDVQKVMAHQDKEPEVLREMVPDVPAWLDNVIQRLMRKTPEERYPSMAEVVAALKQKKSKPVSLQTRRVGSEGEKPRAAVSPRVAAGEKTRPSSGQVPRATPVKPAANPPSRAWGLTAAIWAVALLFVALAGFSTWWFLL